MAFLKDLVLKVQSMSSYNNLEIMVITSLFGVYPSIYCPSVIFIVV